MNGQYSQLRIKRSTLRRLKLASGLTGEKMIDLIERWTTEELVKQGYADRQDLQVQIVPPEKE
jgi:hypothetical protein